jgi:hypothetical protein
MNFVYFRELINLMLTNFNLTLNFLTINTQNFQKLILFECYFINNVFRIRKKNVLQKCSKLLFYYYFRFVLFMYFSFNKLYSKLFFTYLFCIYSYIFLFVCYNVIYFNICITDNLLLFNNVLLENYSIFEDIKFDINNNQDLNKDFNVLNFDNNNKSLIPYNNGNNNNMNNMNNMNNNNNFNDMNIIDVLNKKNKNEEYDTETISLFKKLKHLKQTNPQIFDIIKKHYSDNNTIPSEKSLTVFKDNTIPSEKSLSLFKDNTISSEKSLTVFNNNKINDFKNINDIKNNTINEFNFSTNNNKLNYFIAKNNVSNNNVHVDNNTINNNETLFKEVKPLFEDNKNSIKEELKMPCRIIGPNSHLPIINKTGTMLSLPFYNGTPTPLERLNYELNGTLPDDYISVTKNIIKNTIKQDDLNIIKFEKSSVSNNLLLKNQNLNNNLDNNLNNNLDNLAVPALESSVPNNNLSNSITDNAVASSSKIVESKFVQESSSSKNNSDLLSNPLNYLPDDILFSHMLNISDPNRTDIPNFTGGFDYFGNLHIPYEAVKFYKVPDYLLESYDCFVQYDSDLHPVLFKGMLIEAWKHGYMDTIIEFYLENHNMYDTHYTKENMDVIIKFLADKLKEPNSPTLETLPSLDKGKGKAV